MNNAINEIKNTLEGMNSRIMEAEDRISEVEDRIIEINETDRKNEKKECKEMRTTSETSVITPQHSNHRSLRRRQKKDHKKILEEIIVENFPKMGREVITQVQETQGVPNRINPRRNTPRHILIKLTKIKHKEQLLKAARGKQHTRGFP